VEELTTGDFQYQRQKWTILLYWEAKRMRKRTKRWGYAKKEFLTCGGGSLIVVRSARGGPSDSPIEKE